MFGISFLELLVIGLLALVVLGPEKLPEVARWAGKGVRELRQISNAFRDALMIDDLGGTSRSGQKLSSGKSNPSASNTSAAPKKPAPSAQGGVPPKAAESAPAIYDAHPSTSSEAPIGLDQIDDDHFEKLLAEQYHLHHNQLRKVALSPRKPTEETRSVALSIAAPGEETLVVALPASLSLELTS